MVNLLIFGFIFFSIISSFSLAHAHTVKTNHVDVNLWSKAGRDSGETTEEIKRFEEIQVLDTKRLKTGEVWYRVQLLRYPEGKRVEKTGWVDAKFFTEIETPVPDDQPPESVTEAKGFCAQCAADGRMHPIPKKQVNDIAAIQKSLRSEFIWPVGGYVRSGFGFRKHPIKGVVKLHRGTDISGNSGAKVRAAKSGTVEVSVEGCQTGRKSCNKGAGNMVTIDHGDGTKTRYLHLSPSCRLPRKGSKISQGDVLGCVGATGSVTGPHLHFEVMKNGRWINPLSVLPKRRAR